MLFKGNSTGIHRLAIVGAVLVATLITAWQYNLVESGADYWQDYVLIFSVVAVPTWLLIQSVAWVINGFRKP